MARLTPPWLQTATYPAATDRRVLAAVWPTTTVFGGQVTATGGMVLSVAAGWAAIATPNNTGTVLCPWTTAETVTLDPAPAVAGTNRIDLVVVQARSADIGTAAGDDFVVQFVKGAEAGTPSPPAVPAGAAPLAQITVTGGSAAVAPGAIVDRRAVAAGPRGFVALAWGPPAASSGTAAGVTMVSLAFPSTAGRYYRVTYHGEGAQGAAGAGNSYMQARRSGRTDLSIASRIDSPVGYRLTGNIDEIFQAASTGTTTVSIVAYSALFLNVDPNTCFIGAEDIGGS
jgi:hypothetical protein